MNVGYFLSRKNEQKATEGKAAAHSHRLIIRSQPKHVHKNIRVKHGFLLES